MLLRHARSITTGARWLRAIDVPATKPGIYGYKPKKSPQEYMAFSLSDSQRLDRALQQQERSAIVEENGLFTVDFESKLVKPTFWDGPGFTVRRSLWIELVGNNKLMPINEKLEKQIESAYQANKDGTIELKWPTNDDEEISVEGKFSLKKNQPSLVLTDKRWWMSTFTKRLLFRGIPNSDNDKKVSEGLGTNIGIGDQVNIKTRPSYQKRNIKHLVFCVHGIGQLLSVKFEQVNFVKDVDGLRNAMKKVYSKVSEGVKDKLHDSDSGIQVLPVMWRHRLDDTINGLRPHQMFGTKNLAADAVLDFVMYTEAVQRKNIQVAAAEEMNKMYCQFCEMHPEFAENPRVSIIGHSLGSVIAYDLVHPEAALAELKFPVVNLFTLGSPIGVLDLIRQAKTVPKGRVQNMYNIMRLADPVAARLEPLVTRDSLKIAPKPLPSSGSNIIQQVKGLTDDLALQGEMITSKASSLVQFFLSQENESVTKRPAQEQDVKATPNVDLHELKQFNRHGRLDFSVQESIDLSLLLGLAGHLMYLDNPDVVQFILKELLEMEQEP